MRAFRQAWVRHIESESSEFVYQPPGKRQRPLMGRGGGVAAFEADFRRRCLEEGYQGLESDAGFVGAKLGDARKERTGIKQGHALHARQVAGDPAFERDTGGARSA